jgi:superfamily I DNA/RNA helicase
MSAGFVELSLTGQVYTRGDWDKLQRPTADYIIVDEVQDFSIDEIRSIRSAAKKYVFMFGDSNQSIYQSLRSTTTIEELCKEFDITAPVVLHNCYRLPKSVAPLLPYVLKDVEYVEGRYKNENANSPYIIQAASYNEQLRIIQHDIIEKNRFKEVGILLPSNDMVLQVASQLVANGMDVEIRYRGEDVEKSKQFDTLNFNNIAPKLMTYHSAKGLQFETVIIPLCPSFRNIPELKRLYVALTRTYRNLYILYSGDMPTPLNQIDSSLYKNSLSI